MAIDNIKQRYKKSTPGIWKWEETEDQKNNEEWSDLGEVLKTGKKVILEAQGYDYSCINISKIDADFIAHAHQDIPFLLKEIRRLNRRLSECE